MTKKKILEFIELFQETYIVLLDDNKKHSPIKIGDYIDYKKCKRMNDKGYGVFFTPNGHKRGWKKDNLSQINCWYVDIDKGSKRSQLKTIKASPISPSITIESKRGYHLYWLAKDGTASNFTNIEEGLIEYFGSDPTTKKTNQLLRVPYFYHNKTRNRFKVRITEVQPERVYTEEEMMSAFSKTKNEVIDKEIREQKNLHIIKEYYEIKEVDELFKERVRKEKSREYLLILSGTHFVNYEKYDFMPNKDGTSQILVNGKPSSCWLRRDGSIGSHSGGGPTVIQWIQWFQNK